MKRTRAECLSSRSSRGLSLRLHIGADQGLLKDWEQAALGLLAFGGADVDEVVDTTGRGGSCNKRQQELAKFSLIIAGRGVGGIIRVWQSRMARLRTSVAQQRGEPDEQRPAWRSSRGAAKAAATSARMVKYCMLTDVWRCRISCRVKNWLIDRVEIELRWMMFDDGSMSTLMGTTYTFLDVEFYVQVQR